MDKIKQLILQTIRENDQSNQYSLSSVPFHRHNGNDSPTVQAQNLDWNNFATWGQVVLNGFSRNIVNPRINPSSTVLASSFNTSKVGATPGKGFVEFTSDSSGATLSYLIIF